MSSLAGAVRFADKEKAQKLARDYQLKTQRPLQALGPILRVSGQPHRGHATIRPPPYINFKNPSLYEHMIYHQDLCYLCLTPIGPALPGDLIHPIFIEQATVKKRKATYYTQHRLCALCAQKTRKN